MSPVERVLARFLEARKYTRPKNMVPVYNTESERVVYVLPETLTEEAEKYKKLPPAKLNTEGKPAPRYHPGQPHLPRKPKKPHKPVIEREPPPAPISPPLPPRPSLPPKKPKPVPLVKPPKVPKPSLPEKNKRVKKFLNVFASEALLWRIIERYLAAV